MQSGGFKFVCRNMWIEIRSITVEIQLARLHRWYDQFRKLDDGDPIEKRVNRISLKSLEIAMEKKVNMFVCSRFILFVSCAIFIQKNCPIFPFYFTVNI